MPTITVKLDRKHAARLARWARLRRVSKSQVIRELIDRAGVIETGFRRRAHLESLAIANSPHEKDDQASPKRDAKMPRWMAGLT